MTAPTTLKIEPSSSAEINSENRVSCTLLAFAAAQDYMNGQHEFTVSWPVGMTVSLQAVYDYLAWAFADLHQKVLKSSLFSVNLEQYSHEEFDNVELHAGDEVAIIPAVSGG